MGASVLKQVVKIKPTPPPMPLRAEDNELVNCRNCAAPVDAALNKCSYCGS
tara:strand:+ start:12981 stop:13133 length:153 start_codon:yes stop_codon:yes gene_type:complete